MTTEFPLKKKKKKNSNVRTQAHVLVTKTGMFELEVLLTGASLGVDFAPRPSLSTDASCRSKSSAGQGDLRELDDWKNNAQGACAWNGRGPTWWRGVNEGLTESSPLVLLKGKDLLHCK